MLKKLDYTYTNFKNKIRTIKPLAQYITEIWNGDCGLVSEAVRSVYLQVNHPLPFY